MQAFKTILKLLLLAIIVGCQKDLGVDLPYEGNRLVIFGLISADSVVSVRIDGTAPPTGIFLYGDSVANATVELFEDGIFLENLVYIGNGIYRSPSDFKPAANKGYSLKVTAPNFPAAETTSEVIPSATEIQEYIFRDTISSPFVGDARRLTFTFQDESAAGDFYYVKIDGKYQGNEVLFNTFVADRPLEASEDICGFRSEDNQYILQDICFNGKSFSYHLGVAIEGSLQEFKGPGQRPWGNVACDQIFLRFKKITKTYRDYLQLAGREEEGFLKAFTTPIREYSNIKGGYGVWAAYSEDVVDVLQ